MFSNSSFKVFRTYDEKMGAKIFTKSNRLLRKMQSNEPFSLGYNGQTEIEFIDCHQASGIFSTDWRCPNGCIVFLHCFNKTKRQQRKNVIRSFERKVDLLME